MLDTLLLACGESSTIPILGGDFNACIGMANGETDEFVQHIGPHGMGARNVRGTLLARWISQQGLYFALVQFCNKILETFFTSDALQIFSYNTQRNKFIIIPT